MSRAEHTYQAGDVTVQLIVPDGMVAPSMLRLQRASDGAMGAFTHVSVRNLRGPVKRAPRQVKPLTKIPEDWAPPAHEVEQAVVKAPSVNVDYETAQFVDWAISKGEARADWVAAWRRWIRETHKRNLERGWRPARSAAPVGESPEQRWCREHGITVDEYRARKDDRAWVEMIKRRGRVA